MTRKKLIVSALLSVALVAGCRRDESKGSGAPSPKTTEPTQPTTPSASAGLDVALTPTGQADVYMLDENGRRIDPRGATGRVELPDGTAVPLTPSDKGRLTAPLGEHAREPRHGCNAIVRVTPATGSERTATLDMCRGMGRRGAGHMGHGMEGMEDNHE